MPTSNRRAFLSGRAAVREVEAGGESLAESILGQPLAHAPAAGDTVRLETKAMACHWQVILNPGDRSAVMHASDALDLVHHLESLMTVYKFDGQLAVVNREAADGTVEIDPLLTAVIAKSIELTQATDGAFDATSGPLVALWRSCREENRVPSEEEIASAKERTGVDLVDLDTVGNTIRFAKQGVELNLGAVGKGYALDCAAGFLKEQGVNDFLIHGGASSVLAAGVHRGEGWPVGIKNPVLNEESMLTIVLGESANAAGVALGTSGGNVQYFRLNGRRYGHILDPRTGWPVEHLLSASVVADDAATADALSTAAFAAGPDAVGQWAKKGICRGALLTPPAAGRNVRPQVCQLLKQSLFFASSIAADVTEFVPETGEFDR